MMLHRVLADTKTGSDGERREKALKQLHGLEYLAHGGAEHTELAACVVEAVGENDGANPVRHP